MPAYFTNKKLDFVEDLVLYTDSHIFLTGKAGTGKTTFLRNLQNKTYKRMVVVAPTGVAAINAGGQTIHSFFQLPFGPQIPEDAQRGLMAEGKTSAKVLASQYQKLNKTKLNIMRSLNLLVIDEISMVRADVLDAIDAVLRRARRSQKPFGGVQLLMIGDVHQLAPVAKPDEWEILAPFYQSVYFFGSHVLQKAPYLCVELDHIYRQHDEDFITLLNKVRDNQMDAECLRLLNSRYLPEFTPNDREGYITLTTHNFQADQINESKLNALPTRSVVFKAEAHGTFPENSYPAKDELVLKVGAQVMFVKNDPDKAFFNGKIGRVISINETEGTVVVQSDDECITVSKLQWQNMEYVINEETQNIEEKEIGSFVQIPLRLAWAVTIHKSQGLTFDKLIVDAGHAFAHGQVYVALSRCTSLEGLVLKTRIPSSALVNDTSVNQFVEHIPELEPTQEKVERLRHQYELDTMLELIDFYGLYKSFGKVMKILYDNGTIFETDMIQDLSQRRNQLLEKLCGVSSKFENQIRRLHSEMPSCEHNQALQERLMKGSAYFKEQLDSIAQGISDMNFKTGNKAVNKQFNDAWQQFLEDLHVKQRCLDACSKGFSIKDYQRSKAVAVLGEEEVIKPEKPKKRAKKTDGQEKKKVKKEKPAKEPKISTFEVTKSMIDEGLTPEEIAAQRGLQVTTIFGHIVRLIEQDEYDAGRFLSEEQYDTIRDYFDATGDPSLGAAKDVLGDEYSFDEIRLVLTELKRDGMFENQYEN